MTRFRFPCLVGTTTDKHKLEEGVVVPRMVVLRPSSKFLVGRHQGRGDIVGEEVALCVHVEELEYILVAHNTATSRFRESLGGNNFPVVVGVVVSISSNLLTF